MIKVQDIAIYVNFWEMVTAGMMCNVDIKCDCRVDHINIIFGKLNSTFMREINEWCGSIQIWMKLFIYSFMITGQNQRLSVLSTIIKKGHHCILKMIQ